MNLLLDSGISNIKYSIVIFVDSNGIYSTSYEANYGYCVHSSSMIQTEGEE